MVLTRVVDSWEKDALVFIDNCDSREKPVVDNIYLHP
jgi:hypothetical protein